MSSMLTDRYWQELAAMLHVSEPLATQEWQAVKAAYSEPQRSYHNLQHITAMLQSFELHAAGIHDTAAILAAIFYHDIVYQVPGPENEHRSALRAGQFLRTVRAGAAFIRKVEAFIEATKLHQTTGDSDLDYLLDFDLQILAAPAPVYDVYAQQIRKEYSIYPDILYLPGRKKVLQHFLQQEYIFKTPAFREQYEEQARINLSAELARL